MAFNLSPLIMLLSLLNAVMCQKLLLIMTQSFPGSIYHKYATLSPFKFLEDEGCWSDLVYPVFPSLSTPNQYSLATGKLPRNHGITGDYMYDSLLRMYFHGGARNSDFDRRWWNKSQPIWVTAKNERASVASYFWPFTCQVDFGVKLDVCVPFSHNAPENALNKNNIDTVIDATRKYDFVLAYHNSIARQIQKFGPKGFVSLQNSSMHEFGEIIEKVVNEAKLRMDLNVVVMSDHGITDVPAQNKRFLDDHVPLNWIKITVGAGAVKQIVPVKAHAYEIFETLHRFGSIPNVKVYYTTPRMSNLPKWYKYGYTERIPELLLVAQPGYAVVTREKHKQIPSPSADDWQAGMSGYNNNFPDMLGIFFAYGPSFKRGVKRGASRLIDVHSLLCHILGLRTCEKGDGDFKRNHDILLKAVSGGSTTNALTVVIICIILALFLR